MDEFEHRNQHLLEQNNNLQRQLINQQQYDQQRSLQGFPLLTNPSLLPRR